MKKSFLALLSLTLFLAACSSEVSSPLVSDTNVSALSTVKKSKPMFKAEARVGILSNTVSPANKKIVDLLTSSSKDLTLVSESDEPFKVFVWSGKATEKMTPANLLKILKKNPKLKAGKQDEGLNWLKDYTALSYWTDGGYSKEEAKKLASSYAKFMKDFSTNVKDIELYLVDDPRNLADDPTGYDPSGDFSGEVGFYLFGKVGNDIIGVSSALVWT